MSRCLVVPLTACFAALDGVGVGEEPYVILAYTLRNFLPKNLFLEMI